MKFAILSWLQWKDTYEAPQWLVDSLVKDLEEIEQLADDNLSCPPIELDSRTLLSSIVEKSKYLETLGSPWKPSRESLEGSTMTKAFVIASI